MNKEFWKDKKVLVTGHTGFKGSWLCLILHQLEAKVYGLSLPKPVTPINLFEIANVGFTLTEDRRGDIIDEKFVLNAVENVNPDVVVHLAAQPIVKTSYEDPIYTYKANALGTANVLEACRKVGSAQSIDIITTDKVYGENHGYWAFREIDPMKASDPYSTSKACADLIASSYREENMGKLPVAICRAGNVLGFGDFSYRLVPMILDWLAKEETPIIWDPNAVRPWQYVLDCLCSYLQIAEYTWEKGMGEDWNIAPPQWDYMTSLEIAEKLCAYWCNHTPPVTMPILGKCPDKYPLRNILKLDASKIETELGQFCSPTGSLGALSKVAAYYKAWTKGERMDEICRGEVERYLKGKV